MGQGSQGLSSLGCLVQACFVVQIRNGQANAAYSGKWFQQVVDDQKATMFGIFPEEQRAQPVLNR